MDRIHQPDQQDSPRTEAETVAARILNAAADRLDTIPPLTHPLTGTPEPARCMTDGWRDLAMAHALPTALQPVVSKFVRARARTLAQSALPPIEGSTNDYATRLRQIAASHTLAVTA